MTQLYKVPLVLSPQPDGGFTVTSPLIPELVTDGDTAEDALRNVHDALSAVIELYEDLGKALPAGIRQAADSGPVSLETLIAS